VVIDTREYFHVTLLPDRIESHLDKEWNEKSGYYDHSPTLDRLITRSENNLISLALTLLGISGLVSSLYIRYTTIPTTGAWGTFTPTQDLWSMVTLVSMVLLCFGYLYWDRGD